MRFSAFCFSLILYSFLFATLLVVDCTDQRADTGNDDVGVGAAAPGLLTRGPFQADVGAGAGVRIGIEGVLTVMHKREMHPGLLLDGRCHSVQAAVTGGGAFDRAAAAGDDDACRDAAV